MANELIRPIDEETAKAVQEASKALGKAADLLSGTGSYASSVAGRLPHNLMGLLGDQVFHTRRMRALELEERYRTRLKQRGAKPAAISPSVALPLLEAAIDETREVLKEAWERLLANAADPTRQSRVRLSFIEILKKFDPFDAVVLQAFLSAAETMRPNARKYLGGVLNISVLDIVVSFENLVGLGCLSITNRDRYNPVLTDRGRALLAALEN